MPDSKTEVYDFPEVYAWGGKKHAELLVERQALLSAKFSFGIIPFGEAEWLRLQSIRGVLDAIDEHRGRE
jgi:hypothetical protein